MFHVWYWTYSRRLIYSVTFKFTNYDWQVACYWPAVLRFG